MKKALFILVFFSLLALTAQAQVPQAFKYQAVVRNAVGTVLVNQNVGLNIRLTQADTSVTLYSETHTTTTNAFGLVNLEIGRGTMVSGIFDQIVWGQQPIYVGLSLDASGGTNYQNMGSSELLSVPYALYADNAGGSSGLPADPKTGEIVYYDGTAWKPLPAGAAGTVLIMGSDSKPFWEAPSQKDELIKVTMRNGGVIYTYPTDNSTGIRWGVDGTNITALPDIQTENELLADFNGETNTAAIVAQLGDNNGTPYAAKFCADLVAYFYDDWYLPSSSELQEIYQKLGPVANGGSGQMASGQYWSSTEFSSNIAWNQSFNLNAPIASGKEAEIKCRCIRK